MWRTDMEDGGFPISRRNPVLCFLEDSDIKYAYNRFNLSRILNGGGVKKAIGVWPGKKNTDVFILSVETYKEIPTPPEEHEEIDSSPEVVVKLGKDGMIRGIAYLNQRTDKETVTQDPKVYSYIKAAGIPHRVINAP